MEGRAQPMKSSVPWRIIRAMTSGEVKRPTPTTGRVVRSRMPLHQCFLRGFFLEARRAGAILPGAMARSHRSGRSAFIAMKSRTSALEKPRLPMFSSRETRMVSAIVSPTASRMSAITSRAKRERFSSLPPYSSRALVGGAATGNVGRCQSHARRKGRSDRSPPVSLRLAAFTNQRRRFLISVLSRPRACTGSLVKVRIGQGETAQAALPWCRNSGR